MPVGLLGVITVSVGPQPPPPEAVQPAPVHLRTVELPPPVATASHPGHLEEMCRTASAVAARYCPTALYVPLSIGPSGSAVAGTAPAITSAPPPTTPAISAWQSFIDFLRL